jgi:hypothetical protein
MSAGASWGTEANSVEAYVFMETAECASGIVFSKVITTFDMARE